PAPPPFPYTTLFRPPSLRARRPGKLARPRRRSPMPSSTPTRALPVSPHPTAATIDELVAGATSRRPFRTADAKSGSRFERVEIRSEEHTSELQSREK